MENGRWSLGALSVDSPNYVCADWDSENLHLYFHEEEDEPGADDEDTAAPESPDGWDNDEWDDALEEAAARAEIPASKGTVTEKEIDGREYYYLQWREGETVKSQYVAPVSPA